MLDVRHWTDAYFSFTTTLAADGTADFVAHITGWHGYVIGRDGLRVYPRLESVIAAEGIPATLPPPRLLGFADIAVAQQAGQAHDLARPHVEG